MRNQAEHAILAYLRAGSQEFDTAEEKAIEEVWVMKGHFQDAEQVMGDFGQNSLRRRAMVATISRDNLKAKLDRGDRFQLVEALPESAFQMAHLPGALNLPQDRLRERAPQVLPDKNAEIIVYCASPT
jgi:hypothetical protein